MHQFETSIIPRKVSAAAMLLFVLAMPQHLTAASPPKGAICSTVIATSDFTPYVIPAGIATAELDYIVSNSVGPDKGLVCHIETYTCGYESKVYPPVLATVTVTDGGGIVLFSDTQTSVTDTYPVDNRGFPLGVIPSARTFNYVAHFDVHTLTATSDGTVYVTVNGPVSASVSYSQPPPTFAFDYSSSDPDQKVLAHKYETSDSFPLGLDRFSGQRQINVGVTDVPQVRIRGAASLSGLGVSRDVYFRLIDPPDKALYVPSADRTPGDNKDRVVKRGRLYVQDATDHFVLDATGNRITNDPATGILKTTSRKPDGGVTLVLETTDYAAGDNYQIEVSFNKVTDFDPLAADQPCMTCTKSATYVVWKRVYLEEDDMFRKGAFVDKDAAAGAHDVAVTDSRPFHVGQTIMLIHSDPIFAIGPRRFYSETHTIADITENDDDDGGLLTFSPSEALQYTYSRKESDSDMSAFIPYLADGVAVFTGSPPTDAYVANDAYVNVLFSPAFVEYKVLEPTVNTLPYTPYLESFSAFDDKQMPRFTNRWSEINVRPNHQYLVGATKVRNYLGTVTAARGLSAARVGVSFSYLMMDRISGATLLGEAVAHEVAHQWHVDPSHVNPSGSISTEHDDYPQWDSPLHPVKHCQMHADLDCPDGSGGFSICPEFLDGHVAFHYQKLTDGVDSEYRWIRERCEPIPREYPDEVAATRWWSTTGQCH